MVQENKTDGCLCPVCGYPNLETPPYGDAGEASFEICPSCGTEFGLDDDELTHEELRQNWIHSGAKWYSRNVAPPLNWNGETQLRSAIL